MNETVKIGPRNYLMFWIITIGAFLLGLIAGWLW